jgi:hypothetical protein
MRSRGPSISENPECVGRASLTSRNPIYAVELPVFLYDFRTLFPRTPWLRIIYKRAPCDRTSDPSGP